MAELDTIMQTLREALRGERNDDKRGMRVPIRDLRVILAALERAERDREYLREKNDIIRAYAGSTGMTPEDVAAALERIPELEGRLCEMTLSYHTVCVQVAAFEEAAEKVASAPRAARDVAISALRRVLEGYVGTHISVEEGELDRLRRVEAAARAILPHIATNDPTRYGKVAAVTAAMDLCAALADAPEGNAKCVAIIRCGPGHQSSAHCDVPGLHEQHHARQPRTGNDLFWHGEEGITGFFDESPEEDGDPAPGEEGKGC